MPRCHPFLAQFFDRFLFDFSSRLRPPNLYESSPRCRESVIFEKSPFEVDIDLLSYVGANLRSFFNQKSIKILSKINLQRHQVPDLSVGALPMPQGGPQDDPEGLKTALLALQDAP